MKLAFSTNAFKRSSLEDAISTIASLGYQGVEIMADVPHAYPPDMPPARISALREQLKRLGLQISNMNAFTLFAQGDTYHPTWIENDPQLRVTRISHTQNCIRLLAALTEGQPAGTCGRTISLEPAGPQDQLTREEALDRYEAGLRECLPLAQELGIELLIEPEPGLVIEHSWECLEFLKRVNHPNLRMNCDLGHFYCVDEDPAQVVRNCAEWISHIHIEDIKENRVHQHRVPGEGAMEFTAIFTAIHEIAYHGWVTVELYPYEATAEEVARKAFEFMRKFV